MNQATRYMLDCLAALADQRRWEAPPKSLTEDQLIRGAAHHGLAGYLLAGSPLSQETAGRLRAVHALATVRTMAAVPLLLELTARLESVGARYLLVKGIASALVCHGEIAKRPLTDVDVLIEGAHIGSAKDMLREMGFDMDSALELGDLEQAKHVSMGKGPVRIELHRRLFDNRPKQPSFDALWQGRSTIQVAERSIPVLGAAHCLWHLSVHGNQHAFSSLKWLGDLVFFWKHDRSSFRSILKAAYSVAVASDTAPQMLAGWLFLERQGVLPHGTMESSLGLPIRKQVQARLLTRSTERMLLGGSSGPIRFSVHRLLSYPVLAMPGAFFRMAFTPTRNDWQVLPWVDSQTPLLFSIVRPFRILARYFFPRLSHKAKHASRTRPVYLFD